MGCAKCDDTHPRGTVVYNACYYLFRKRLCTPMHQRAYSHVRLERDSNTKIAIYVMRGQREVQLSPVFGDKKQKNVEWIPEEQITHLNHRFQIYELFEIVESLSRNSDSNMKKWTRLIDLLPTGSRWWRHFQWECTDLPRVRLCKFVGCYLQKIPRKSISTTYVMRRRLKPTDSRWMYCDGRSFCADAVCDGSGGVNAICSPPEVDDIISGDNVDTDTLQDYVSETCWQVYLSPIFGVKEQ